MHICIHLIHFYAAMLLCFSSCSWYTFVNLLLFTSFIIPEGGRVRRGTSAFGSRPLHGLPPPSSRSPIAPCLHQGAVTSPAPSAITPGTLNLMLPRNRRSLIPPCRPSTSPRLQRKMAAHFPPLSKQSACRGQRRKNEHGALTNALWSHFSSSHHRSVVFFFFSAVTWACVGSVTKELEEKPCSRPATARARWEKCTKAAWRSGCLPPTPATVNSVTQNSPLSEGLSRSRRSAGLLIHVFVQRNWLIGQPFINIAGNK